MASRVSFDTPIQSNDQSFDRVLKAGLPVVALFWSRPLDSALEGEMNAAARAEAGKLLVVKIKIEDNPELTSRYSIRSSPTLIAFRDGQELNRVEAPTATLWHEAVNHVLGRGPAPRAPERPTATEGPRTSTGYGAANAGPRPGPNGGPGAMSGAADGRPITITDQSFQHDVMQSQVPVVVDFWAPWCGPCRMVAPTLERLAAEYAGRLRVAKLNVDDNPRTAQMHQVQGIPTMLFVKDGRIVNRVVGALPERQLRVAVEQLLGR